MKYTYSDDEGATTSDAPAERRSNRNSGIVTPEPGPTVTASGRQVRSRFAGPYGQSALSGQTQSRASTVDEDSEGSEAPRGMRTRGRRSGLRQEVNGWGNVVDKMLDEEDASSSGGWSGGGDDEDVKIQDIESEDEDMSDEGDEEEDPAPKTLLVTLRYPPGRKGFDPHRMDLHRDSIDEGALKAESTTSDPVSSKDPASQPGTASSAKAESTINANTHRYYPPTPNGHLSYHRPSNAYNPPASYPAPTPVQDTVIQHSEPSLPGKILSFPKLQLQPQPQASTQDQFYHPT